MSISPPDTSIELRETLIMDRGRSHQVDSESYEPLLRDEGRENGQSAGHSSEEVLDNDSSRNPFAWTEYAVFLLLGVAILWAW